MSTRLDFADARSISFMRTRCCSILVNLFGRWSRCAAALKPGGLFAVRDSDYASLPGRRQMRLTRWLEVYRAVARRNGGEPDAGRFLKGRALEAGFTSVHATSSTWTYADADSCAWWGGLWADRC